MDTQKDAILAFNDKWCAQCYTEKRVLNEFVQKDPARYLVKNYDAEEDPKMFKKYDIKHTPSTILIKNGKVVEEFRRYLD